MINITLLGTGEMGSRFAQTLLEKDFNVTIYNRTKKRAQALIDKGATFKATPIEAVKDANYVISIITNDDASKQIWLDNKTGAIHGLQKDTIAIESSTVSTSWITKLANEFKLHNIEFLDAPVVGSLPQADAGQLIYLVGGNKSTLDKATKLLSTLSQSIHHIGANGSGIKMKLAVNALFSVQVAALGEIIGLMNKSGISIINAIELLQQLPTTCPALKGIGNLIATQNFEPLFPITLVEKDLAYITELAANKQSKLPMVQACQNTYRHALEKNYGDLNISAIAKLYC